MKKFYCEAPKRQWEKPTEPKYIFCTTAKTIVYAENEAEAVAKAGEKLRQEYYGTGVLLGGVTITKSADLPVDWNYGYGDGRGTGTPEDMAGLTAANVIR